MAIKSNNNEIIITPEDMDIIIRDEWLTEKHIDYFDSLLQKCSQYKSVESKKIYFLNLIQQIVKDVQLNDIHINYFGLLLKNCSEYLPREWKIQCADTIEPVSKDQKHIQILYSCSDTSYLNGHWVCSYYDTKKIYIYDSLNLKWLYEQQKIYLEKLFPFYPFEKKPIQFSKVQEHSSSHDSGIFAIAFAVSLLFNLRPDIVLYDVNLMREHLMQMFKLNKLEHFPRIIRPGDPKQLFSLDEIQRRKVLANKKRERRQSKIKNEYSVKFKNLKHIQNSSLMQTNEMQMNTESYINNFPKHINKNISININCNITEINAIEKNNELKLAFPDINLMRNILPMHKDNIQTILRGEWLEDIHIDHFGSLLKIFSEYEPRDSWKIHKIF